GTFRKFYASSPKLTLNGDVVVASLEFVPFPEIQSLLPEDYRPDRLQFSRNFLLSRDGIQADPDLAAVQIPKNGDNVSMDEQLKGRISAKGWPVVLVQSLVPGQPWWIQRPVETVEKNGEFTVLVTFGEPDTQSETRYRVVILVAK